MKQQTTNNNKATTFEKAIARVRKMNLVSYAGNGKTLTGKLHDSVGHSRSSKVA